MNQSSTLITGATGNVGREIIKLLDKDGIAVRAAVTSLGKTADFPASVTPVLFDFTNPATYTAAFQGIDKLFLMRPPHISNIERDMQPALEAAIQAGVTHIVFLSLLGADQNRFVPHAAVEKFLLAAPVDYTLLRCGFFMQNLSTTHRHDISQHNDIFIPAGKGKTAFIDARDIAAVAVKTLLEPGHEQQSYPLTGDRALDYAEAAAIMSQVLQRPIRYSNPSLFRFIWRFWRRGHKLGYIVVVAAIYMTTRFGLAATITPHTAALLGHPPISFEQFVHDHKSIWQPAINQQTRSN